MLVTLKVHFTLVLDVTTSGIHLNFWKCNQWWAKGRLQCDNKSIKESIKQLTGSKTFRREKSARWQRLKRGCIALLAWYTGTCSTLNYRGYSCMGHPLIVVCRQLLCPFVTVDASMRPSPGCSVWRTTVRDFALEISRWERLLGMRRRGLIAQ